MVILAVTVSSCAQSAVRPVMRLAADGLPRPPRIFIYDVVSDGAKVTEYTGILRQQPANPDPADRLREIRANATAAFASVLTTELKNLGFAVTHVSPSTAIADDDLVVAARLRAVDPGDPLRRLIIGLGSGASRFEIMVTVYQGSERRKLLEFTIQADSGRMPGAAVTLPAGAAVQGGLTAGLFASSAASSTVSAYHTNVTQMASACADQGVRYLSEFFAGQGWISSHLVRKARIAYQSRPTGHNYGRR